MCLIERPMERNEWKCMKTRKINFPQKPNSMSYPNFCVSVLMFGKYKIVQIVTPQGLRL